MSDERLSEARDLSNTSWFRIIPLFCGVYLLGLVSMFRFHSGLESGPLDIGSISWYAVNWNHASSPTWHEVFLWVE